MNTSTIDNEPGSKPQSLIKLNDTITQLNKDHLKEIIKFRLCSKLRYLRIQEMIVSFDREFKWSWGREQTIIICDIESKQLSGIIDLEENKFIQALKDFTQVSVTSQIVLLDNLNPQSLNEFKFKDGNQYSDGQVKAHFVNMMNWVINESPYTIVIHKGSVSFKNKVDFKLYMVNLRDFELSASDF